MESKDWAFERTVDRDFLDAHLELIEYVTLSLRQQMADHILGLLQQDSAMCIQRGEMTMHNDDARRMVSFEETLRMRPLVLCKDCKWRPRNMGQGVIVEKLDFPVDSRFHVVCPYASDDPWYNTEPGPNGFCSKGEREGVDEG